MITQLSAREIESCFELLCDALEEGCGCDDLGSPHCIMLTEYIALCELRDMAMRQAVSNQDDAPASRQDG